MCYHLVFTFTWLHFISELKAQRGEVAYPRSHSKDLNPDLSPLEAPEDQ